jgi:hypothetical protein
MDDESGTHQDTVDGTDFKILGEKLTDITNLDGGPDIMFTGRRTSDQLGFEWLMRTGTAEQPQIVSSSSPRWAATAPQSPVSGLTIDEDASKMASISWQVGGRTNDTVLVSRAVDDSLTNAGYPLMEVVDSSHSSVSFQGTLDDWAAEQLLAGQSAQETWAFDVQMYPVDDKGDPAGPQFGSYSIGDFAVVGVDGWDPDTGVGDPYIPKDEYRMRIIGLASDELADEVTVTCAPRMES